jgi:hypothetical protein
MKMNRNGVLFVRLNIIQIHLFKNIFIMKIKYLIIIGCVLLSTFSAEAQLKIGIKGGANYSQLKESGDIKFIDWEAYTNFYAGGFAELELNDRLSARVEALYSFEGGEFDDGFGKNTVELNYLNLPILLRINLFHGIFVDAGIEPGVVINNDNPTFDNDTEVGVLLGGGFRMGERLVFNLRYVQGLSSIYDFMATDVNGNTIGDAKGKSTLWQIGAEFYIFK